MEGFKVAWHLEARIYDRGWQVQMVSRNEVYARSVVLSQL